MVFRTQLILSLLFKNVIRGTVIIAFDVTVTQTPDRHLSLR